jgi:hypothetical protein
MLDALEREFTQTENASAYVGVIESVTDLSHRIAIPILE